MFRVCWLALMMLSGCAYWPSAEHRQLTPQTLNDALQSQRQQQLQQMSQQWLDACQGMQQSLGELNQTVQRLAHEPDSDVSESAAAIAPSAESTPADVSCLPAVVDDDSQMDKVIVGSVEWLYLPALQKHLPARIDSGAATSSLSATHITPFERNGKRWVRFTVNHEDIGGQVEMESPIKRYVRIRQASSDELDRRAVVTLTVSLGKVLRQDAEFTLTDRRDMDFPLLLGREFLRDVALIDVAREHIHPKANLVTDDQPAQESAP